MARELSLNQDDLNALQQQLLSKRFSMKEDDVKLAEMLLKTASKAKATEEAAATATPDVDWTFTWTYRF